MVVVGNSQRMNQHKRGQSLFGFRNESHGLAKDNRRNLLTTSMDDESLHSAISKRLGKVSVGTPPAKSTSGSTGMEDLLTSDREKHDYDWLLTPPGTPLGDKQVSLLAPTPAPATRPTSATKTFRISTSHSDVSVPAKPTRSTSTTRPSTALSGSPKSVLSTSSMSVNSRPSTPNRRSTATSQSRPATPSRTKPAPATRPSTPTSRAHIPSVAKPAPIKPTSPAMTRTTSRPSTPTRRAPTETPIRSPSPTVRSPATTTVRSPATTTRSTTAASHARSPSPKPHTRKPLAIPDFPTEAPPNLRTTAPERPSSVTRSRPNSSHGTRSTEIAAKEGPTVRRPSPARGREHSTRDHVLANGHSENNQTSTRIPASRPMSSSGDNGGFGRTISKKSMDMALRHMDIRHSSGNIRPLAGSSLFPQSIRPNTFKIRPDTQVSSRMSNGKMSENGHAMKVSDHENSKERSQFVDLITERLTEKLKEAERMRETEISVGTRYDAFLLKEDLKNTEWLHSLNDQSPIFDQRFEQLPEPFSFT